MTERNTTTIQTYQNHPRRLAPLTLSKDPCQIVIIPPCSREAQNKAFKSTKSTHTVPQHLVFSLPVRYYHFPLRIYGTKYQSTHFHIHHFQLRQTRPLPSILPVNSPHPHHLRTKMTLCSTMQIYIHSSFYSSHKSSNQISTLF